MINGNAGLAVNPIYSNPISAHIHEREDEEFHLIIDSISDKAVRNQVYKDVVSVVNELNQGANHYTLSSMSLPSKQEILAISGVTSDNFEHVSSRIMHIMGQKGYTASQNLSAA